MQNRVIVINAVKGNACKTHDFLRPLAKAQLERSKKPTNVDSFIGQDGIVLEAINNELDQGLIRFKGIEWRARSVSGERIGAGRKVTIVQIKGVTLLVK